MWLNINWGHRKKNSHLKSVSGFVCMVSQVTYVLLWVPRVFFLLPNRLISLQSIKSLVPVRVCSMKSTENNWLLLISRYIFWKVTDTFLLWKKKIRRKRNIGGGRKKKWLKSNQKHENIKQEKQKSRIEKIVISVIEQKSEMVAGEF